MHIREIVQFIFTYQDFARTYPVLLFNLLILQARGCKSVNVSHERIVFVAVIEKVGEFVLEHAIDKNTSKVKRKVKLVLSKEIIWPGDGTVPRDSPICGFEGEFCLPHPSINEDKGNNNLFVSSIQIRGLLWCCIKVGLFS